MKAVHALALTSDLLLGDVDDLYSTVMCAMQSGHRTDVAGARCGHAAAELFFLKSLPTHFALCGTEQLMVIAINVNYKQTGKDIIKKVIN